MIPAELAALGWPQGVVAGFAWFLGPTANVIRKNIATWTDYQTKNLLSLAQKTQARDVPNADSPGSVHPRVAQRILAEASLSDDDVMQEYFAGMLIGARSTDGHEGDNSYYAHLVSNLSSDQLRLHHIIYAALTELAPVKELRTTEGAAQITGYISLPTLGEHVRNGGGAAMALHREQLIGEYTFDPEGEAIPTWQPWAPHTGFVFKPTPIGAGVFLKAYGRDVVDMNRLFDLHPLPHTATPMPIASEVLFPPGFERRTA